MIKDLKVGSIIKGLHYVEGKKGNKDEISSKAKTQTLTIVNQELESRWCGLSSKLVPKQVIRRVKWIPFAPNAINYIELDVAEEVISGFFSGCVMSRYKRKDGKIRVAHVSTGKDQETKPEWKAITEEVDTEYVHFKPFGPGKPKAAKVLGVITNTKELYSVWCNQGKVGTDLIVAAIDKQQNGYGML